MIGSTDSLRALVDTNVVVYAHDPGDAVKHERAKELVTDLSNGRRLIYSVQVVNKFCAVMMRSHRMSPLSPEQVRVILDDLDATGEVVLITVATTSMALGIMSQYSISFWDALIWAAAKENGVALIYSEDFQHGQEIEGVRFLNPFAAGG